MTIERTSIEGGYNYVVTDGGDQVVAQPSDGIENVYSSAKSYVLGAHLENLTLFGNAVTGWGNALDNWMRGNALDNTISGLDGNDHLFGDAGADMLYGGNGDDYLDGGSGADVMQGEMGNDGYVVDSAADRVVERPNQGIDLVYSMLTDYTLADNVEHFQLIGMAQNGTGNAQDNVIGGNAFDNRLDGAAGNDALYGGAGNDTLIGGAGHNLLVGGVGDDTYSQGEGDDTIFEADDEGFDTYVASRHVSTLAFNVEHLLLAPGYRGSAFANDQANRVTGNDAANTLFGLGGDDILFGNGGSDRLFGGDGNDTLVGGPGIDELFGGAGTDIAVFAGNRADWDIRVSGGTVHVDSRGGADHAVVQDVEFLQFADTVVPLDGALLFV